MIVHVLPMDKEQVTVDMTTVNKEQAMDEEITMVLMPMDNITTDQEKINHMVQALKTYPELQLLCAELRFLHAIIHHANHTSLYAFQLTRVISMNEILELAKQMVRPYLDNMDTKDLASVLFCKFLVWQFKTNYNKSKSRKAMKEWLNSIQMCAGNVLLFV
jgi:hypothetical protein